MPTTLIKHKKVTRVAWLPSSVRVLWSDDWGARHPWASKGIERAYFHWVTTVREWSRLHSIGIGPMAILIAYTNASDDPWEPRNPDRKLHENGDLS